MDDVSGKLFSTNLGSEKLHPNFKYILREKEPYLREVLQGWGKGFIDRDKKFVNEFQTTFNSSFWELYLFAVLKDLGLNVNFNFDRPDFVIDGENGFCIEATIASNAKDMTPEWERTYSDEQIEEWKVEKIVENATLRLANAFVNKSNMYLKSYEKLEHVKNKPYVIAIAPFDSPYFFLQNHQPIIRVLYGFDRYIAVDWDEHTRDLLDSVFIDNVQKNNGSTVPLGYFTNPNHSHVSAVIFSNVATVSKARVISKDPRVAVVSYRKYNDFETQPTIGLKEKSQYQEDLLDGLVVFHNPYADIPFNIEEFLDKRIGHYDFDIENKDFISDIPHGLLFQRQIQIYNTSGYSKNQLKKFRESTIRKIRLGELGPKVEYPILHK